MMSAILPIGIGVGTSYAPALINWVLPPEKLRTGGALRRRWTPTAALRGGIAYSMGRGNSRDGSWWRDRHRADAVAQRLRYRGGQREAAAGVVVAGVGRFVVGGGVAGIRLVDGRVEPCVIAPA